MKDFDADARAVLARYGLAGAVSEPLGNAGGFSGARIWRVRLDEHQYCLKHWPVMSRERHAALIRLIWTAREAMLPFVPTPIPTSDGNWCVEGGTDLWDVAQWMPGVADYHSNASPARLRAACVALARLHRVWERLSAQPRPCPGATRRLILARSRLAAAVGPTLDRVRLSSIAFPFDDWMRRAEILVNRHLARIPDVLGPWRSVPVSVQPCLCDVWHDHVLFTGDEVTGLIDYGAAKVDNVAVDLARLLGSLVGNDSEMYELGLDQYAAVRPLTESERGLVRAIDRASVILSLENWCRRLNDRWDWFGDRIAVGRRIQGLVRRAEAWEV
jgi:Ser/Thr protein kinase RdoA (MazF antagonist)